MRAARLALFSGALCGRALLRHPPAQFRERIALASGLTFGAPALVAALVPNPRQRALVAFALLAVCLVELPLPRKLLGRTLLGPLSLTLALARGLDRGPANSAAFASSWSRRRRSSLRSSLLGKSRYPLVEKLQQISEVRVDGRPPRFPSCGPARRAAGTTRG